MSLKDKIFHHSPMIIQNIIISVFNYISYRNRYGGSYMDNLLLFKENRSLSLTDLEEIQKKRYSSFIRYVVKNSPFYQKLYRGIEEVEKLESISQLPIVDKEVLRQNINDVYTISAEKGILAKTGGTTGKSLKVIATKDNVQERFAMLDDFRGRFGYKLGKRTAWFSGKNLLTPKDIRRNRFWKTDWFYNVRYYSTFHIKKDFLHYYLTDLLKYKPEYLVGFPSTIAEIAKHGEKVKLDFPIGIVKAVFPTAETVSPEMRNIIEGYFKTSVYDQYASSEGAPFIFECEKHMLHLELQSGVYEVLDENNEPTNLGRLIVTSFTTEGTPLIRYDIGDGLELGNVTCDCGNNNPVIKQILGRIDDYVFSPENGKINLGNVSNTLKDVFGVVKFQVQQDKLDELDIILVTDNDVYNKKMEEKFLKNWEDRIGQRMKIHLNYVNDIPVESSGKFRIVKNNIKDLVD